MANKYTATLNQEQIDNMMNDPENDGISVEAVATDGSKVMVTLMTSIEADATESEPEMGAEEVEMEGSAEVGAMNPEEEAAGVEFSENPMESRKPGFTNENTIASFENFLKL